ncbi:GyrI-like domain-containing protein [Pontibacter vulgaris]|uniref:GyrI-like domain-containing protein n=1 Tax=Pontibacter vulgaris TaxID=2905679 RepID=UPI001FA80B6B|nr:GyrI-like domain-containing protein [Pontibacter vulgaris]
MKKFLYVVVGIAILGMVFYTYMGGFATPEVKVTTSETKYIAGQPFSGSVKDEALGKAFQRAAEVVDKKELQGVLGSIYYNDPDKTSDSLKAFIGVIVPDKNVVLPAGFELRTIPGGKKVVHAEVEASIAMAPKRLYAAVFDYAKEEKLKLETFYVEWFPEEKRGVVEVPIKQ